MKAADINLSELNPAMKGCKVRVRPLFCINNHGKQMGYGLNLRLPGEKRFKSGKFCPFLFDDGTQAVLAAAIINKWSESPAPTEAHQPNEQEQR